MTELEKALLKVEGVTAAKVDVENRVVTVAYKPQVNHAKIEQMQLEIAKAVAAAKIDVLLIDYVKAEHS